MIVGAGSIDVIALVPGRRGQPGLLAAHGAVIAACVLLVAGALIVSTEPAALRHPGEAPRVVLDTNVCLALFAYADASCAALLAALRDGQVQAVANPATRIEWLQVLARDALKLDDNSRSRAAQVFDTLVTTICTDAAAAGAAVRLPRCRDRDDQMFLELARDAGAVALYTRDRELLKLSRRTQRHAGFAVLLPEDWRNWATL